MREYRPLNPPIEVEPEQFEVQIPVDVVRDDREDVEDYYIGGKNLEDYKGKEGLLELKEVLIDLIKQNK